MSDVYCRDCKHSFAFMSPAPLCQHPSLGTHLVTGQPKAMMCSIMRGDSHKCGREGKLFEVDIEYKVPKKNWFDKLIAKLFIKGGYR